MSFLRKILRRTRELNRARIAVRRSKGKGAFGISQARYLSWIDDYDTIDQAATLALRERMAKLDFTPKIAVIMPVFNPDMVWLREAVESVRRQIYPHWELCIADDASPSPEVKQFLSELAKQDSRIKLVYRSSNGHISACTNSAAELVTAPYISFLDQDDILREHALLLVAESIARYPGARLIYSDEDKIDEKGRRCEPHFKPDWNPELLLAQNYISHLTVIDTSLFRENEGLRAGLEGAQDHDLMLRCTKSLRPREIVHIPHVLYHWRRHAGSTSSGESHSKNYAATARLRAVRDRIESDGQKATVELSSLGWCRVQWKPPLPQPLVSIIIPTRNRLILLRNCIDSIVSRTTWKNYEVIVIDNGSDDEATLSYMKSISGLARIRVIRDEREFNYSALNNMAARQASGEYIVLMNNDVEVITPAWLEEMVSLASRDGVGAVGAKLLYEDHSLQHGGIIIGIGEVAGHSHKGLPMGQAGYIGRAALLQEVSAVTGACLVVKASRFAEVNGLDEKSLAVAFNDVDFCLRLREKGYRNLWTPEARLLHLESASRGRDDSPEKRARFLLEVDVMRERWGKTLQWDFAYNPNLTHLSEDFSLAYPPRVGIKSPWFGKSEPDLSSPPGT